MTKKNAVVAICGSHDEVESAERGRQQSGLDLEKRSIAGRSYRAQEDFAGGGKTGEGVKFGSKIFSPK